MKRTLLSIAILAIFAMMTLPSMAAVDRYELESDFEQAPVDEYSSGEYGRLRHLDDGVLIQRADDEGTRQQTSTNSPIFPGDAVASERGSRAEIELAGGTLVWVDGSSAVQFLSLPSPYVGDDDRTILQLLDGSIRVMRPRRSEGDFRVDGPGGSAWIDAGADVRLSADRDGSLQAWVFRGSADLTSGDDAVRLQAGMRAKAFSGGGIDNVREFNTLLADRFDNYVLDRKDLYASYSESYDEYDQAYEAAPEEIRPHWRELSSHGRWIYVPGYGHVWSPRDTGRDWRPYRDGYWAYGPRGYFWVSYEPWGWAPYRYGRWSYISNYGWCWSPGRLFGGAWVSWSYGSLYLGWAPLNYYNRPAYYGSLYYNYYDPYCWNFIRYSHLGYRNYRHIYVGTHSIGDRLRRHAIVTRAPRVAPRELASSRETRESIVRTAFRDGRALKGEALDRRGTGRRFMDLEKEARRTAVRQPSEGRNPGRTGVRKPGFGRKSPVTSEMPGRGEKSATRLTQPGNSGRGTAARGSASRTPSNGSAERGDAGSARDRARSLYQRLKQPRETSVQDRAVRTPKDPERVRPGNPSDRRVRPGTPGKERVRPGTPSTRPQPRATPRSGSSSSRSTASPRSRGSSSRQEARPRSGGSSSRPKATPRSSGSSSRPQARPRSGGSYSRPKASPRSSGSSSRPQARPRSGGSYSRPKATSQSGGSSSRPKASPRSSGSSSRPQARPRSGGSYSRPKATPRSGGSSSRPQARPRSGGSSSRPKATPRSSGSSSRPKAAPKSSSRSGSSRGKAKRND